MVSTVLKVIHKEDVRRMRAELPTFAGANSDAATWFRALQVAVAQCLSMDSVGPDLVLKYKDEDGDLVSLADTNDLSYAIQYSRVLRLTILQQGEALVKTNSLDLGIIKELRTIRDKVNKVLDMVAVETIKDSTGDTMVKEEAVTEAATEAVSQLQLEQSKEFDPLEQSQAQPETPEKSRQQSGQSSASSQQYPASYQPQPPTSSSFSQSAGAPAFPPSGPPASSYPPAGPRAAYPGQDMGYAPSGPPTSNPQSGVNMPSYAPPSSTPGYSQPPSGPPVTASSFHGAPPTSAPSNPPSSAPSFPPTGPTSSAPTYPTAGSTSSAPTYPTTGPTSSAPTYPPSGPPASGPGYQPTGPPSSAPSFPPTGQLAGAPGARDREAQARVAVAPHAGANVLGIAVPT